MKTQKFAACLAIGWAALLACNEPPEPEPPKVENCIELTYLFTGCQLPAFSLSDTSKLKGDYWRDNIFSYGSQAQGVEDQIALKPPYRTVFGIFWIDKLKNMKFIQNKKYHFEYRQATGLEKISGVGPRTCYPSGIGYTQIVLLDTLTSKCTRYQ